MDQIEQRLTDGAFVQLFIRALQRVPDGRKFVEQKYHKCQPRHCRVLKEVEEPLLQCFQKE